MIQVHGIWLPAHEKHLQGHILKGPLVDGLGTYQHHKIEMALAHTKGRRVVVDVGAHVGLWSRILAIHFDQVHAFEPSPDHCACFKRNVTSPNVTLHPVALGSGSGRVRIDTPAGNSGHTHVVSANGVEVPLRRLDSFDISDVDLIKIDTEGYEREVLAGALETLGIWKPTLIVEQKPGNARRYGDGDFSALRFLEILGAKNVAQKSGDYVLTW